MPRPTEICIDLGALRDNTLLARRMAGERRIMAAVKADAYGHGLLPCAAVLQPLVDGLAVACCEEAFALRKAQIAGPIVILEGPFDSEDIATAVTHQCWMTLHSLEQIALLEDWLAREERVFSQPLWLKVDTGMHRLGVSIDQLPDAISRLQALGVTDLTLISHLAHAESPDDALTANQLEQWQAVVSTSTLTASLMNSAGLMNQLVGQSDWLRPGYMLYGGKASPRFAEIALQPVMTLSSAIMATRCVPAGDTVGYGGRWRAERDSVVATIPVGYGDGYPRTAENGTPVFVDGVICPLVGRVSMDMITVDITDHATATVGTPVQLWGSALSVDTVASHANTIGYELLTRLTSRARRRYRAAK